MIIDLDKMRKSINEIRHKIQNRLFFSLIKRRIRKLRPVNTETGRKDVAIGFLTSNRHLPLMMVAAKSFYHFSEIICPLYIWDDGSLLGSDYNYIRSLFPSARILRRFELDMDVLSQYALTSDFAQQKLEKYENYAPALKIFGPFASPNAPHRFILSDSDAFFFDWPQEINDWLQNDQLINYYISPWSGSDNVPEDDLIELYSRLNISSCPRINSGLLLLDRTIFDLDTIETILNFYKDRFYAWDIEQTIYRILMARSNSAPLDRDNYVLCHRKFNATCHHFFTSIILHESVVRNKILNLLEYMEDCERREKPQINIKQRGFIL